MNTSLMSTGFVVPNITEEEITNIGSHIRLYNDVQSGKNYVGLFEAIRPVLFRFGTVKGLLDTQANNGSLSQMGWGFIESLCKYLFIKSTDGNNPQKTQQLEILRNHIASCCHIPSFANGESDTPGPNYQRMEAATDLFLVNGVVVSDQLTENFLTPLWSEPQLALLFVERFFGIR